MPVESDYLRRQAERCLHWAGDCFDLRAAGRLRLIAEEFLKEADRIERSVGPSNRDGQADNGEPGLPRVVSPLKS